MRLIHLDAFPSSNLEWEITSEGTYFLDFDLTHFDPFDEGQFFARFLAVEEFVKRFPNAKEVVLGCVDGTFSALFKQTERFEQGLAEKNIDPEIYSATLFSQYLHRLASCLPDEMQPLLLCEIAPEQKIEEVVLPICRRRFEHFGIRFTNRVIPIEGEEAIAISLPQDEKYDPIALKSLFNALDGFKYKCIPEEHLNEHWDGVDIVVVDEESLGDTGRRMLLGFEAAGGRVVYSKKGARLDLALISE